MCTFLSIFQSFPHRLNWWEAYPEPGTVTQSSGLGPDLLTVPSQRCLSVRVVASFGYAGYLSHREVRKCFRYVCWQARPSEWLLVFMPLAFATEAAWHGPEVFLPQALLRDRLKPESQPRRRKQVPLRERELSKQSLLQLGTISVQRAVRSQISGKGCRELDWKTGGDHHSAPRVMTAE